jgi:glycine cleavage system regulatory protein
MKVIKAKTSLATLHNARNLKVYIKRNDYKKEQAKPLTYKAHIDHYTSRGSK